MKGGFLLYWNERERVCGSQIFFSPVVKSITLGLGIESECAFLAEQLLGGKTEANAGHILTEN